MKKREIDLLIQRACSARGLDRGKFLEGGSGYFLRQGCVGRFFMPQVNVRGGRVLFTGYAGIEVQYVGKFGPKNVVFIAELSNFLVDFDGVSLGMMIDEVSDESVLTWVGAVCGLMNCIPPNFEQLVLALRGEEVWSRVIKVIVDRFNDKLSHDYKLLEEYVIDKVGDVLPRWESIF